MDFKRTPVSDKKIEPGLTSEDIEQQIKAFKKAGGKVKKIAPGVSGEKQTGRKHISINNICKR